MANHHSAAEPFAKLGDFGLSRRLPAGTDGALTPGVNQPGTPGYTAGEVWRDRIYVDASDIYMMGMLVFECVTQKYPYSQEEVNDYFMFTEGCLPNDAPLTPTPIQRHNTLKAMTVAGVVPRIKVVTRTAPKIAAMLQTCWARNAKDRYTAAELCAQLEGEVEL